MENQIKEASASCYDDSDDDLHLDLPDTELFKSFSVPLKSSYEDHNEELSEAKYSEHSPFKPWTHTFPRSPPPSPGLASGFHSDDRSSIDSDNIDLMLPSLSRFSLTEYKDFTFKSELEQAQSRIKILESALDDADMRRKELLVITHKKLRDVSVKKKEEIEKAVKKAKKEVHDELAEREANLERDKVRVERVLKRSEATSFISRAEADNKTNEALAKLRKRLEDKSRQEIEDILVVNQNIHDQHEEEIKRLQVDFLQQKQKLVAEHAFQINEWKESVRELQSRIEKNVQQPNSPSPNSSFSPNLNRFHTITPIRTDSLLDFEAKRRIPVIENDIVIFTKKILIGGDASNDGDSRSRNRMRWEIRFSVTNSPIDMKYILDTICYDKFYLNTDTGSPDRSRLSDSNDRTYFKRSSLAKGLLIGVVEKIEKCIAKKSNNKFNIEPNTPFYRVYARPYEDTP